MISIRNYIIKNFKNADKEEFTTSINSAIKDQDEITLPGLGVFFEIVWENSDDNSKEYILNTLKSGINLKS